jgi:selenophosphate synthase
LGAPADILELLPLEQDPSLFVGREISYDAGGYRLTTELALVQTIDFITLNEVNAPYDFGRNAPVDAVELMASNSVNAKTDITGFGLLGHALAIEVASGVHIFLVADLLSRSGSGRSWGNN